MLPCPNCGTQETNGTFCTDCLKKLRPLVRKIKPAKLTCCVESKQIMITGTWKPIEKAITKALGPALVLSGDVSQVEIEVPELEWKPGIQKTSSAVAIVTGKNEDAKEEYEEQYEIPINYLMTLCPEYKKKGTTYFEGILQVRNETEAARKTIGKYMKEHRVDITKSVELNNGTDYFLTDHRAVGHLAQRLHKEFGGELKVNAQHFSEDKQRSKVLYRTNALVHLPNFKKGDVLLREEKYLLVKSIGTIIGTVNLQTGSKSSFPYIAGESEVLPVETVKVTNTKPIEVLHPKTFEPITPINIRPVTLDSDVRVAVHGDILLLTP